MNQRTGSLLWMSALVLAVADGIYWFGLILIFGFNPLTVLVEMPYITVSTIYWALLMIIFALTILASFSPYESPFRRLFRRWKGHTQHH